MKLTPVVAIALGVVLISVLTASLIIFTQDSDEVTLDGPGVIRYDWLYEETPITDGVRRIIQGTRVDGVCVYTYRRSSDPNDPPKIQRTLASNPTTCEELVEEGTLDSPSDQVPEDQAMESVAPIFRACFLKYVTLAPSRRSMR